VKPRWWQSRAKLNFTLACFFRLSHPMAARRTSVVLGCAFLTLVIIVFATFSADLPAVETFVGNMYYHGRVFRQNYESAASWYRLAAERGNRSSQVSLASAYENGYGVPQDIHEAEHWYRQAAEHGDLSAQKTLIDIYTDGRVEQPRNPSKPNTAILLNFIGADSRSAAYWCRRAAEQGDTDSQLTLGGMFENGIGIEQDYTEATIWYQKAAEKGNRAAKDGLRRVHELIQ
jgi:TPR repeat protein